ncbi:MAG: glycosyltransferase [Akkermansia sp.]|nr:glycosyltransferase [Akkermansia sp.]
MKSGLISVIVPVYKTEKFLQECIDSILVQTYPCFELILVDDGSPDSSGEICDRNAAADSRIRVIHQSNQGVTLSRANGVAASVGEFVTFVDSDDRLLPDALDVLVKASSSEIDIVIGKHQRSQSIGFGYICIDDYRELCATIKGKFGGLHCLLYRRSLLTEDVFDIPREVYYGEDAIMNIKIAYKVTRNIYNTDTVIYYYRINPDSVMQTQITPEAVSVFQKYRLASIPPGELKLYLPKGLADDLICKWMGATCNKIRLSPSVVEAHSYLLKIKKYSNIRLGMYPLLLFYCINPFSRLIIIGLKNCIRMLFPKETC